MEKTLYLIWKDSKTRRNYTVGKLSKNAGYSFEYIAEADDARKAGWKGLEAFPDKRQYLSDILFPSFSSRLPDQKRRDINRILEKYSLSEYDEFELLRSTRGRLPIDTYELIDPIFPEDSTVERDFYIMGIRHRAKCEGKDCSLLHVSIGDCLTLQQEPENEYDPNAIRIYSASRELLGYVPRYYSEAVTTRLKADVTYTCKVIEANMENQCEECVKVRLHMPKIE